MMVSPSGSADDNLKVCGGKIIALHGDHSLQTSNVICIWERFLLQVGMERIE